VEYVLPTRLTLRLAGYLESILYVSPHPTKKIKANGNIFLMILNDGETFLKLFGCCVDEEINPKNPSVFFSKHKDKLPD
jgi:hypothetical protein